MKSRNIFNSFLSMFNISRKNHSREKIEERIELEIETQKKSLEKSLDKDNEYMIRKKIIYLNIKKVSHSSLSRYIQKATSILEDETDDSIYEAIAYLKRVPQNIPRNEKNEIFIFKALLYELIDKFKNATQEYQKALKTDVTPYTLKLYKDFVERSRERAEIQTNNYINKAIDIYNDTELESMPDVVSRIEKIAKYYARSPKSRSLGKRYFKEVLKMYKKLSQEYPKKFTCKYVNALIEAVDIFMFSPFYLKDAEEILFNSDDCIDDRVFLIDKINDLKEKDFIKNSLIFS